LCTSVLSKQPATSWTSWPRSQADQQQQQWLVASVGSHSHVTGAVDLPSRGYMDIQMLHKIGFLGSTPMQTFSGHWAPLG
jgi:hypothetical protein